jgi:predicted nucleotidyltransferase
MGSLKLAMRVLFNRAFSEQVATLDSDMAPRLEIQQEAAPVPPAVPPKPVRSDAVTLLETLQREARLIDFFKEPIDAYQDAQIGAAVRDIHRDSGKVLERLFELRPVLDQAEGSSVDLAGDVDVGRIRLTGNVTDQRASSGKLVHHGWEATKCDLPEWSGADSSAGIVAAAEVEV